ncbi:fimbrial protein [Escherichia coli]|uniref:fimbrial protein n=1 Tax=Escherichia coli TaxID=562 RepID=UPI001F060F3E|nr:fimbrial protein [Escherichia coli]MCH0581428.1 fimbrial protein [Escherichia coli]
MKLFIFILLYQLIFSASVGAMGRFSPTNTQIPLPPVLDITHKPAIGEVLWTSDATETKLWDGYSTHNSFVGAFNNATLSSYGNNVYETGVKGIGFRFRALIRTPATSFTYFFGTNSEVLYWKGSGDDKYIQKVYLELIATLDSPDTGVIDLSHVGASLKFNYKPGDAKGIWWIDVTGSTSVNTGACTLNNYENVVDFGTVSTRDLARIGKSNRTENFSISLSCNNPEKTPAVTFEGTTSDVYSDVFVNSISGDGYAENVGFEILMNGKTVTPGRPVSLGKINTAATTDYTFTARLFRLPGLLSEGSLDVPVTFTLSYE